MPSRIPSRLCRVHSSVFNHPCRACWGGLRVTGLAVVVSVVVASRSSLFLSLSFA